MLVQIGLENLQLSKYDQNNPPIIFLLDYW